MEPKQNLSLLILKCSLLAASEREESGAHAEKIAEPKVGKELAEEG